MHVSRFCERFGNTWYARRNVYTCSSSNMYIFTPIYYHYSYVSLLSLFLLRSAISRVHKSRILAGTKRFMSRVCYHVFTIEMLCRVLLPSPFRSFSISFNDSPPHCSLRVTSFGHAVLSVFFSIVRNLIN